MLTVKCQTLLKDNHVISELIKFEVSRVHVREYTKEWCPKVVEIVSSGWGTMHLQQLEAAHQRIYVVNDAGKTVATYDIPSLGPVEEP